MAIQSKITLAQCNQYVIISIQTNTNRINIMKALSLFNGISGLHLALDKSGIEVDTLYYAEIDKFANKVTETQYPNDIPLGDVTKCERLQNIPDNFTDCISNSQRYKAIGNGWTINVISHILDCAFKEA